MMGHDMSSNMMVDNAMGQKMYSMGKDMSSTMMGHDLSSPMIGSNMGKMMRQNKYQIVPSWDETMMGNNVDKTMMGRNVGKTSQPMVPPPPQPNVGNNMDKTMMGVPLVMLGPMLGHNDNTMMGGPINMVQHVGHNNMLGHNMDKKGSTLVFGFPGMGHRTYTNMMGRDMASNMVGQDMPSHTMGSQDMYTNANLMGRDMSRMEPLNTMSHKIQIETMPSQSFTRFF